MDNELVKKIKQSYREKEEEIIKRLREFKNTWESSDEEVFYELCFCICTPQTKALVADKAVMELIDKNLLLNGNSYQISRVLKNYGVRFHRSKSMYIVRARNYFTGNDGLMIVIKDRIPRNTLEARDFLVRNVKGIGYKEASHFLRNVGHDNIAILDRHVIRTLFEIKVIDMIPSYLTRKRYLEIERKFIELSKALDIVPAALDLTIWYLKTGIIFK